MFLIYDLIYYSGRLTSPYPSAGDLGGPRYTHQNYSILLGQSLERPSTLFDRFCKGWKRHQKTSTLHYYLKSSKPMKKATKGAPSTENDSKIMTSLLASTLRLFETLAKVEVWLQNQCSGHFCSLLKKLIFQSKCHWFFKFFQNHSWRPFVAGPSPDLICNGRFGRPLRFSETKNALGTTLGSKKSPKEAVCLWGLRVLLVTTTSETEYVQK